MTLPTPEGPQPAGMLARQLLRFSGRVLRHFFRNHGILLAGGVGYNVLLSVVPLLALFSVLLTHVVDEQRLLEVIMVQAQHLSPAHADLLVEAVMAFLDSRDIVGLAGIPMLLFFSSFAFRMLEDSIAIIFHQPDNPVQRNFWVSAVLPYAFMLVLGVSLLLLTLLFISIDALHKVLVGVFDLHLPLIAEPGAILYLLSFVGLFVLFSAIYKVLPVVRIATQRALVGGLVAAILWEGVRLLLTYYFFHVSFVNVIYGSLATLIVLLITLEAGALILLLGAQVIAELERSARAGLPWHQAAAEGWSRRSTQDWM